MRETPRGRLIGLDLGSRRIGVAVTDAARSVATGVTVIERGPNHARDHRMVAELVQEYEAVGVVVGLPLSMSGVRGPAADNVMAEVSELSTALDVEVQTMDERLSTVVAAGALRAGGRSARRQKSIIDQTAAAAILQSWVDRERA